VLSPNDVRREEGWPASNDPLADSIARLGERRAMTPLSATLQLRPDAERVRLRLGTEFVIYADALFPEGRPPTATDEWICANTDSVLALLEQMIGRDGQGVRRLPHRLHWLLWLLAELDVNSIANQSP
jgi:hypothetical protein